MLMTVVIKDAEARMSTEGQRKLHNRSLQIVLYADDTLLIGYEEEGLQDLLEAVS